MEMGYFQVEHGEQKDMSKRRPRRSHRTMEGFLQGPLQRSAQARTDKPKERMSLGSASG